MSIPRQGVIVVVVAVLAGACSRSGDREYELKGQVLAVDQARQEVTIKHEDIPRFMPGMTMAFRVHDRRLLDGRVPGDLVRATLVVGNNEAHLRTLERTGFAAVTTPPPSTHVMDVLEVGEPVADASFRDERGAARRLTEWRGRVLAVTFTYTRCPVPNFCPLMDRHFKAVQEQVRGDAQLSGRVQLLSVTIDPAHDTPQVLATHAATLGADPAIWSFLTADAATIRQFASQFGLSIVASAAGETEIVHNLRTAVIDGSGKLAASFSGNEWTVTELVQRLRDTRAGH